MAIKKIVLKHPLAESNHSICMDEADIVCASLIDGVVGIRTIGVGDLKPGFKIRSCHDNGPECEVISIDSPDP